MARAISCFRYWATLQSIGFEPKNGSQMTAGQWVPLRNDDPRSIESLGLIPLDLIDATGKVVERWKHIPTKFFIDTRKYKNGHYLLKITTNLKSETLPVVINHN